VSLSKNKEFIIIYLLLLYPNQEQNQALN